MSVSFKCEYCERVISEDVCPFCGGVNKVPRIGESESEGQSPETQYPAPEPDDTLIKRKKSLLLLAVLGAFVAFLAVVVIVGLAVSHQRHNAADTNISAGTPRPDKNGYMLKEEGYSSSDHVLEGFPEEHLLITFMGKETELVLPCSFNALKETYHIMPVTQYLDNEGSFAYSSKEVTTVPPLKQLWIYESYNVLDFCLFNGSEQERDFKECICDSFSTVDITKVSSLRFHDIELMTDIAGILDSLGEPSFQFLSDNFYSIDYNTTCGRLNVNFLLDEDGIIGNLPFSVTVENCKEVRPI